jgi:transposase
MPEILENADDRLTACMRRLLDFLWQEWKHLQLQIESLGPLVAPAVVSAIGNGSAFHKGREFAAWLVLVPR